MINPPERNIDRDFKLLCNSVGYTVAQMRKKDASHPVVLYRHCIVYTLGKAGYAPKVIMAEANRHYTCFWNSCAEAKKLFESYDQWRVVVSRLCGLVKTIPDEIYVSRKEFISIANIVRNNPQFSVYECYNLYLQVGGVEAEATPENQPELFENKNG